MNRFNMFSTKYYILSERLKSFKASLPELSRGLELSQNLHSKNKIYECLCTLESGLIGKEMQESSPAKELQVETLYMMKIMRLARINADDANGLCMFIDIGEHGVDMRDSGGDTMLNQATLYRSARIVEMLLKRGANPFIENEIGLSPFSRALEDAEVSLIKRYMQHKVAKEVYSSILLTDSTSDSYYI